MTKFFIFIATAIMMAFTSCSTSNPTDADKVQETASLPPSYTSHRSDPYLDSLHAANKEVEKNTKMSKLQEIPVGSETFKKLVAFIEKNGFPVVEKGVWSDHQYTVHDKKGNLHGLITIKRDSAGNPSTKGRVHQISVWAYEKGIQDQKHFFGYQITEETVAPYFLELNGTWKGYENVKVGYEEFLAEVMKAK
jgi:hypothetical protein